MTVINTNVKALYTQAALKVSNRDSQVAMQQLSTGKRINSSKDDAAGLAIAARMSQNIQGLKQAVRNAGDAISMIQTAEGATQEITVMLQRMSELAVQASNSTYSDEQRGYLDQEFQQLKQEIVRISDTHEWNGFPILNGRAGIPVGAPKIETMARAGVNATSLGKALNEGDLEIQTSKGSFKIPASLATDDSKSSALAFSSNKAGSAIAIAAAINSKIGETGVNATVKGAVITASKTTVANTSIQTDLYVNGEKVSLSLSAGQTTSERRQYVMESINVGTATHGVSAGDGGNGGLTLTTIDGRNLSVWYDSTSVQGSDFGLGLDTATASNPLGVTGIAGAAGVTAGSIESSTITFAALKAGQQATLNGLTFTASADISAADVALAFSSLPSGASAVAANATHLASATKGVYSGTFFEGFKTGVSSGATVTATALGKGNVGDIKVSGSATPTVAQKLPAATTPTVTTTSAGVGGVSPVNQVSTVTFSSLAAGQSVTLGGITFTSGTAGTSAAELAAAFATVQDGYTNTAANSAAGTKVSAAIGTFTAGTFAAGCMSVGTTPTSAKFTATNASSSQISLTPSLNGGGTAVPTITATTAGTAQVNQVTTLTFKDITAGQTLTLGGLTFTAGTGGATKEQLAAAFATVQAGFNVDAANSHAGVAVSSTIGRFTAGTFAAGCMAVDPTNTDKAIFTATSPSATQIDLAPAMTGGTATPSVATTTTGVTGVTAVNQISTITFSDLVAGQKVTIGGLTFTSGTGGTTKEQLAAAFATVQSGSTASAANSTATSSLVNASTGTFTDGTFVSTGSLSSVAGRTDQVKFTATAASSTQVALNEGASKEQNNVTFSLLGAGQKVTVGGLSFTATSNMTAAEVAGVFAGKSASDTTPANPSSGTFSGNLTGFNLTATNPVSTSIIAEATANGPVTDIAVQGPGEPTVVTTNGQVVAASTAYGTVVLTSNEPFTIKPGDNAYAKNGAPASDPTYANFSALGFEAKSINAKNIGRLSFQVGPAENQLINIDMADFGANGDITGPITSDTAPTNIRTVRSATDVILNVNKSLDRIAETRATMGAVMNRLEHVMDNLTNVVMNSEASRSQIEDADYAQASTELARTQIMQQAATAVLAQANTSQQTVLKLLQG
mgnify:CR=1 FL=1